MLFYIYFQLMNDKDVNRITNSIKVKARDACLLP